MASRVGIRNKERFRRLLKALPQEQRIKIRAAIIDQGAAIVRTQKQLAPVLTGALRNSIVATPGDQNLPAYAALKSRQTTKDPELSVIITAGNSGVRYAHLVEFGTERMAKQSFFYPGFRAHRQEAKSKIKRAARAAIKDAVRNRLAGIG